MLLILISSLPSLSRGESPRLAAEAALKLVSVFENGSPEQGIQPGMSCRIGLHLGDVMVIDNPITKRPDYFGQAVHTAARLEPVAEPGHVFCTESVARALNELKGMAPKAWPLGEVELAKNAGREKVFVVTGVNTQMDPTRNLKEKATYDEMQHLRVALEQQVGNTTLYQWLRTAKLEPSMSAQEIMECLRKVNPRSKGALDTAYWILVVEGFFKFKDIFVWWNEAKEVEGEIEWPDSIEYVEVSQRGRTLMRLLAV